MIRVTRIALVCLGVALSSPELPAQESIVLAQHQKLPLLGEKIVFLSFRPTLDSQRDLPVLGTPGTWDDVRLVAWKPPVATISGRRPNSRAFETAFIHFLSFPEAIRPKLSALAPLAAAAAQDKKAAHVLVLKDGRELEDVTLLYAVPSMIHVSHSKGEEDIPLSLVESAYAKQHGLTYDSVYVRRMTLKDGSSFEDARIVAQDSATTRVLHSGGSLPVKMDDLPQEVADLVQKHLVAKGLLAKEVLSNQARAQKNRPASAPVAVEPSPSATPKPELIRKAPFEYAQLPLSSGQILRNVRITGFDRGSVYLEGDPAAKDVSRSQLPPEVLTEAGDMPYELLQGLLKDGLVARQRSPIYAAVRNPDLTKPFENTSGGKEIAHVGTGYLAKSNRHREYEGATAGLPKPLGGQQEAFVLVRDFAHLGDRSSRKWWNESETKTLPDFSEEYRLKFKPIALEADSVLLDPFEGKYTLFGNERKVMKNAWEVDSPNSRHHAFVETANGFYFGILSNTGKLEEAKMTWAQLLNHQSTPFVISKVSQRAIKTGQPMIKLSDADGSEQSVLLAFHPDQSQILASHYRRLTEQGIPGLTMLLRVPQTDNVEMTSSETEAVDYTKRKEVVVDRMALEYVSETDSALLTKFVTYQRERVVEHTGSGDSLRVINSPWKDVKKEALQEIPKEADGCVRLTDGKKIYEIQPNRISDSQLVIYEVKANPLDKKPR